MTDRKSDDELVALLRDANTQAPVGSEIRHEKSGGVYVVMGVALRESDLAPLVLYRNRESIVLFSRPLDEIMERFTFISKTRMY